MGLNRKAKLLIDKLPGLVMTNSSPWYRCSMEIDGLPINSMVDLSMANC